MILFNREIYLETEEQLNDFCLLLRGEIFDEGSDISINELIQYLQECFIADAKMCELVYERISDDLYPITLIDFNEVTDFTKIDFAIMSTDENRQMTAREEVIFRGICDSCFGHIRNLFDRICAKVEQ